MGGPLVLGSDGFPEEVEQLPMGAQTIDTKSADYTLVLADDSKIIAVNSSSNRNVTVDGSLDLAVGKRIDILRQGTGEVTVVASGATVNSASGLRLRARYSMASLVCVATDSYVLVGDTKV